MGGRSATAASTPAPCWPSPPLPRIPGGRWTRPRVASATSSPSEHLAAHAMACGPLPCLALPCLAAWLLDRPACPPARLPRLPACLAACLAACPACLRLCCVIYSLPPPPSAGRAKAASASTPCPSSEPESRRPPAATAMASATHPPGGNLLCFLLHWLMHQPCIIRQFQIILHFCGQIRETGLTVVATVGRCCPAAGGERRRWYFREGLIMPEAS